MVYKCFNKKSTGSGVNMPLEFNEQQNYTNQLLENFKKGKVYSGFKDNI